MAESRPLRSFRRSWLGLALQPPHLTGYDLSLEDLKNFRQLGSQDARSSRASAYPRRRSHHRPARSGLRQWRWHGDRRARFWRRPSTVRVTTIIDHYTYGIVSDGDLMEGVRRRGGFARRTSQARQADLSLRPEPDHPGRHHRPLLLRGCRGSLRAVAGTCRDRRHGYRGRCAPPSTAAQAETERPSLICCPNASSASARRKRIHSAPTARRSVRTKCTRPRAISVGRVEPAFYVPEEAVAELFTAVDKRRGRAGGLEQALRRLRERLSGCSRRRWSARSAESCSAAGTADLPNWEPRTKPISTRKASGEVIQAFFPKVPTFIGGSADLDPSTNTAMKGAGDFESAFRRRRIRGRRALRWRLGLRRAQHPLRYPRARDGQLGQRHGRPRRRHSFHRDLPRLLRLHAPADSPRRALASAR